LKPTRVFLSCFVAGFVVRPKENLTRWNWTGLDWTASFCETVLGVEELETVARKDGVAVSNSSEFLLSTSIDDPV
jgi:hypothetical protein